MTPSLMDNAYKWFSITWFGSGNRVGSTDSGVSYEKRKIIDDIIMRTFVILTQKVDEAKPLK